MRQKETNKTRQAAVPRYLGSGFDSAPPGHRYRLYLEYWSQHWDPPREAKLDVLQDIVSFPEPARQQLESLLSRQEALASKVGALTFKAFSSAPFTTGLGIEHPTENGFAFLDPYGLPYLPGSSVKGVVRRAAEELALFEDDTKGWSIPAVWWLFGFDENASYLARADGEKEDHIRQTNGKWQAAFIQRTSADDPLLGDFVQRVRSQLPPNKTFSSERFCSELQGSVELRRAIHLKGALDFWDVLPSPPDHKLRVDIMNPHYSDYYQKSTAPGDWGSPNPIFFLTLPPATEFRFHARLLHRKELPGWFLKEIDGRYRWMMLVEAAFAFAFEWLGFGAKTAVGYGRFASHLGGPEADKSISAALGDVRKSSSKGESADSDAVLESALAAVKKAVTTLNPKDRSSLDSLVNMVCRHHRDPMAAELAREIWEKVKHLDFQETRLKKNSVFMELVKQGGTP